MHARIGVKRSRAAKVSTVKAATLLHDAETVVANKIIEIWEPMFPISSGEAMEKFIQDQLSNDGKNR